jgi:hypothetical protein
MRTASTSLQRPPRCSRFKILTQCHHSTCLYSTPQARFAHIRVAYCCVQARPKVPKKTCRKSSPCEVLPSLHVLAGFCRTGKVGLLCLFPVPLLFQRLSILSTHVMTKPWRNHRSASPFADPSITTLHLNSHERSIAVQSHYIALPLVPL